MPQRELFRNDTEKWMRKYDRPAYQIWVDILRPELGYSVKKADYARRLLGRWAGKRRIGSPYPCKAEEKSVRRCIRRIHRRLEKSEGVVGALITFGFLYRLSIDRKRKLLRRRSAITQS